MVFSLKGLRRLVHLRIRAIRREFINQFITEPLEPVLHSSGRRLIWLGSYIIVAHLGFWWIWSHLLPQPFESFVLRFVFALMGPLLIYMTSHADSTRLQYKITVGLVFWLQLPCFTFFMYMANDRNAIWLATLVAVVLIYHNITDWRLASGGVAAGFLVSNFIFEAITHLIPQEAFHEAHNPPLVDAFVIGFAWAVGAMLGLSAATRQKEQLTQTLSTMGIMAHELRTPLSSIGLIANSIDRLAVLAQDPIVKTKLTELSRRTQSLTVQMNHQIDTQIVNARLEHLPVAFESISAAELVSHCVRHYPFKSKKEARCWRVDIVQDFSFSGSKSQMGQVLSNLIKNAITAMRKANAEFAPGSLDIKVYVAPKKGYITVKDQGTGIDQKLQRSIFEPFFSTNLNTGHGLGLAFCRKVVQMAGGNLTVQSQLNEGACFIIELPLERPTA